MTIFRSELEEKVAELVSQEYAEEFEFAERLHRYWRRVNKNSYTTQRNIPPDTLDLAMLLDTQACRLFRSIIDECRQAETFSAGILGRSLFETAMALIFILNRRVRMSVEPQLGQGGLQKIENDGTPKFSVMIGKNITLKQFPSRQVRTGMYRLHAEYSRKRLYEKMSSIRGNKRFGKAELAKMDPKKITDLENRVGPGWAYVIRKHKTYSGLQVAVLAEVLHSKIKHWQLTVYHVQSGMVHSASADDHGVAMPDGSYVGIFNSTPEDVLKSIQMAVSMFTVCVSTLQSNLKFGTGVEVILDQLFKEQRKLFPES